MTLRVVFVKQETVSRLTETYSDHVKVVQMEHHDTTVSKTESCHLTVNGSFITRHIVQISPGIISPRITARCKTVNTSAALRSTIHCLTERVVAFVPCS